MPETTHTHTHTRIYTHTHTPSDLGGFGLLAYFSEKLDAPRPGSTIPRDRKRAIYDHYYLQIAQLTRDNLGY